jgi:alanine racemase
MRLYRSQKLMRPDLQAHIYSDALLENVRALRSLTPEKTKFCAVVKANAYGHGIGEIVNILKNAEVDFFAVTSFYEAVYIRPMIKKHQSIFVLEAINPTQPPDQITWCAKSGIACPISSAESMEYIAKVLAGSNKVLNVHLNIETGMGRCGLGGEEAKQIIDMIDNCKNTTLAGVYTHFATADEEDLTYAHQQLGEFNKFLDENDIRSRPDTIIHAANSAATIKMPEAHFDMVRCGISLYGYYSRPMQNPPVKLKPVVKLQAPIVRLKHIEAGQSVSYGRSFVTKRDTVLGIVPLGYADGYWRCFSNTAKMKLGDKEIQLIGRVCMDQFLVDLTEIDEPKVGQMVTVIDNSHDSPCGGYALAEMAGTICYEIFTCIHAHVTRIIH